MGASRSGTPLWRVLGLEPLKGIRYTLAMKFESLNSENKTEMSFAERSDERNSTNWCWLLNLETGSHGPSG